MNIPDDTRERLRFLARVVERQSRHLQATDAMLVDAATTMRAEINKRGWMHDDPAA